MLFSPDPTRRAKKRDELSRSAESDSSEPKGQAEKEPEREWEREEGEHVGDAVEMMLEGGETACNRESSAR